MTDTWDLSPLFSSDTDPTIELNLQDAKTASYAFVNKWQDRTDYLENPAVLKQALDEYEYWAKNSGISGHAGYYFSLRLSQDQSNPTLKARDNQITDSAHAILNDISFFTLRLAKASPVKQAEFIAHPKLAPFKHFLETLFASAKYHLSEPEEKILVLKSQPAHANWIHMLSEFISTESRDNQTFENLLGQLKTTDKTARDQAASHINDILAKFAPIAEHELNSLLQNKKIDDQLRGFSRPDSSRHLSDDIDTVVVDTLIHSVTARFDIPRRFYELKTKLLGLPKLAYHERVIPYGDISGNYPFDQSVHLVQSVFSKLDQEIGSIFTKFVTSGAFDVYPRPGKRGSAFCTVDLIIKPTYILLNHTGKFDDVLTLAHECGHGVNNELMRIAQHALNFGTPLSTAEVASTFFEDFVLEELARQASDEKRLAIMVKKLDADIATIFRQIAFYNFETELHSTFRATGYLSHIQIGELFAKHTASYLGDFVSQDPGSLNWWIHVSHFRNFFYVYSYASGLLISKTLQAMVNRDPATIAQVKVFLSAGTSASPKDVFSQLGIDITDPSFWSVGLSQIDQLLTDALALAKQLGKI